MTKPVRKTTTIVQPAEQAPAEWLNRLLLICCAVLVAARCQMHEAFALTPKLTGSAERVTIAGAEQTTMLVFAGLIFTAAALWLAAQVCTKQLRWRPTALLAPLLIMLAAAIISTAVASNKHTALVGAANLIAHIVLALLLVQLLDQPWKRHLLLCVMAATGAVMAYRCWEQFHYELPLMAQQYADEPNLALSAKGIEPGTHLAEQFAGRIASRDVGGYFAISNTTAAFFILSIMATLAVILHRWRETLRQRQWLLALPLLVLAAQVAGLLLTQSKGGIVGFAVALLLLGLFWWQRRVLHRHWRAALVTALVLIGLATAAVTAYGITKGRLPTNSMWVRWQYWHSSAAIIADHWFTGVGPENFGQYYPRYMPAGAPEVVKDPHCFPIALWSQWGLLGLIGMGWAMIAVTRRLLMAQPLDLKTPRGSGNRPRPGCVWLCAPVMALAVVLIRLAVSDLSDATHIERLSVYLMAFVLPTVFWLAVLLVMLTATTTADRDDAIDAPHLSALPVVILSCGLLGFFMHNSIDFAIFQPGVGTFLAAAVAIALALRQQHSSLIVIALRPHVRTWWTLAVLPSALAVTCFWIIVVIPVARAQAQLKQAQTSVLQGPGDWRVSSARPRSPMAALDRAAELDRLNPEAPYLAGRLALLYWQIAPAPNQHHWQNAIAHLQTAAARDPAHFRYYRQLSDAYRAAGQAAPTDESFRRSALDYADQALQRNPGNPELLIDYGKLLSNQGHTDEALRYYRRAAQSEQALLDQQRQMNPHRNDFPGRLSPAQQRWLAQQITSATVRQTTDPDKASPH